MLRKRVKSHIASPRLLEEKRIFLMHFNGVMPTECHKCYKSYIDRVARKHVLGVSYQVRHKSGRTVTGNGKRLVVSGLGRRGTVLSK